MDITFSNKAMIKFLENFDYIGLKYGLSPEDELYVEAENLEAKSHTLHLTKRSSERLADNIALVYGNDPTGKDFVFIYNAVMNEIVYKYLNVPGTEMLFDEHFFEFEWDMHSRMNFKKHEISFYRDHFIHQVRNLFEMCTLLKDNSLYKDVRSILLDQGYSKISRYIAKAADKSASDLKNDKERYDFLNKLYERTKRTAHFTEKDFFINHCIKYIIYAASMLAALFHDIGYPIEHFLMLRERISEYLPVLYMFINGTEANFDAIRNTLSESMLFSVISAEEIKLRLKDKDHGVISAIAFLLQLYETGGIYSLPEEKRAAVELAALIIYNHTIKYKYVTPKEKMSELYYRPIYAQNPLSYLFRFCDDIQEWDRTYFEIRDTSSIIYCQKCKTPLLRLFSEQEDIYDTYSDPDKYIYPERGDDIYAEPMRKYVCRCSTKKSDDKNSDDRDISMFKSRQRFTSRKIINVCTIHRVYIDLRKNEENVTLSNVPGIIFDYNQYDLLKVLRINPMFAKKRIEELNFIKKFLWGQHIANYKNFTVEFSVSANPLILKTVAVENFIKSIEAYEAFISDILEMVKQEKEKSQSVEGTQLIRKLLKRVRKIAAVFNVPYYKTPLIEIDRDGGFAEIEKEIKSIEKKITSLKDLSNFYKKKIDSCSKQISNGNRILVGSIRKKIRKQTTAFFDRIKNIITELTGMTGDTLDQSTYNFMFYLEMAIVKGIFGQIALEDRDPEDFYKEKYKCITGLVKKYKNVKKWYGYKGDIHFKDDDESRDILLRDLAYQIAKEQKLEDCSHIDYKSYSSYMESDDEVYSAVSRYVSIYHPFNRAETYDFLDFNTDLYLYKRLNDFSDIVEYDHIVYGLPSR